MADTRFNIKIFLEGYELDLADNIDLATTYTIANVQDISLISSNYTKSINLPGTKNNNKLFNWLYRIDSTGDQDSFNDTLPNIGYNFNFKKKAKAYIVQDNQVILNGYAKLQSATINNGLISYNIQITSELGALISDLGDKKLEDLDLYVHPMTTGFTHTFATSAMTQSWTQQPATSYFYPLIDYGDFDTLNGVNFYKENMRPCLFAKQYVDMVFSAVGYTYSSGFMNSDYFKRLIIPFSDGNLVRFGDQTIISRGATSGSITEPLNYGVIVSSQTFFDAVISDTNSNYTATTQTYHCSNDDTYKFDFNVPFHQNYYASSYPGTPISNTQLFLLGLEVTVYNNYSDLIGGVVGNRLEIGFAVNNDGIGGVVLTSTSGRSDQLTIQGTFSYPFATDNYLKFNLISVGVLPLNETWNYNSGASFVSGFTENVIDGRNGQLPQINISKIGSLTNYELKYRDFAIKNVKCSDFLSSIFKLFNLYVVPDNDQPKHFNIYTRDEFFGLGTEKIWTDKIDLKSDVSIVPIPLLDAKQLYFTYKEDKDWYNTEYTALNGGVYGDLRLDTGYEFTKDTKLVLDKMIFSPTPIIQYDNIEYQSEELCTIFNSDMGEIFLSSYIDLDINDVLSENFPDQRGFDKARVGGSIKIDNSVYRIVGVQYSVNANDVSKRYNYKISVSPDISSSHAPYDGTYYVRFGTFTYVTDNNKAIPAIYQTSDNNVTRKPYKANPRILYWAGNVDCNRWYLEQYVRFGLTTQFIRTGLFTYPYCSHLNAISGATADLLFDQPKQLLFNYKDSYPTFNLYTGYWINTTNEILDQEAKLFTGNFKLNTIDISNVGLNDSIFIDNTEYRINQIKDFKADKSITTNVELVRKPFNNIVDNPVYTASTRSQLGLILYKNEISSGATLDNIQIDDGSGYSNVFIFNDKPIPYPSNNRFSKYKTGRWPIGVYFSTTGLGTHYIKCTDSNGTIQSSTNPLVLSGSGSWVFNNVVINESNPVIIEVLDGFITTTTTTTIPPINVIANICGTQTSAGHAQGFITTDHNVNTDITVNFYVNFNSGAEHLVSGIVLAGTNTVNWSHNYSTLLTFVSITLINVTPTSSGNYNYFVGSFIGSCGGTRGFTVDNESAGSIVSNVTWNTTSIGGISFPVNQGTQQTGSVPAELGVVIANITGAFGYIDMIDSSGNFQELTYTGGSNTYTFYNVYGNGFDAHDLSVWDYATTTTIPPTTTTTTTTTIPPQNVTITVCADNAGNFAEGMIMSNVPVDTDVDVYIRIQGTSFQIHYQNLTIYSGGQTNTFSQFWFPPAALVDVQIISITPSSFGSQTFINGGYVGSCP